MHPEVPGMLGVRFVDEADFTRDEADVAKLLNEDGKAVVQASYDALSALSQWSTAAIDQALRKKLVEEPGLKPRNAFGPVRVAVTGRRISPPLFESLELLGRERGLGRPQSALGCAWRCRPPGSTRSDERRDGEVSVSACSCGRSPYH